MQTQSVQESGQTLHQHQDGDGETRPEAENNVQRDTTSPVIHLKTLAQYHVP